MRSTARARIGAGEAGAAAVELAILAPVFVLLLWGSVYLLDLQQVRLKQQEAARYLAWEAASGRLAQYGPNARTSLAGAALAAAEAEMRAVYADMDSGADGVGRRLTWTRAAPGTRNGGVATVAPEGVPARAQLGDVRLEVALQGSTVESGYARVPVGTADRQILIVDPWRIDQARTVRPGDLEGDFLTQVRLLILTDDEEVAGYNNLVTAIPAVFGVADIEDSLRWFREPKVAALPYGESGGIIDLGDAVDGGETRYELLPGAQGMGAARGRGYLGCNPGRGCY